jgi:hypothetical protein
VVFRVSGDIAIGVWWQIEGQKPSTKNFLGVKTPSGRVYFKDEEKESIIRIRNTETCILTMIVNRNQGSLAYKVGRGDICQPILHI